MFIRLMIKIRMKRPVIFLAACCFKNDFFRTYSSVYPIGNSQLQKGKIEKKLVKTLWTERLVTDINNLISGTESHLNDLTFW
jgi:hypothetical protein